MSEASAARASAYKRQQEKDKRQQEKDKRQQEKDKQKSGVGQTEGMSDVVTLQTEGMSDVVTL